MGTASGAEGTCSPRSGRRSSKVLLSTLSVGAVLALLAGCGSAAQGAFEESSSQRRLAPRQAQLVETDRALVTGAGALEPAEEPVPHSVEESQRDAHLAGDPEPLSGQAAETWEVVSIIDGDTIDVRSAAGGTERVRIIGIDTVERGECGFAEAADALASVIANRGVTLPDGARDDRDRYGRLLRYVDVDGVDVGRELLAQGHARARYDSRDGYGRHAREDEYVAMDAATPASLCPDAALMRGPGSAAAAPASSGPGSAIGGAWASCGEARAAGAAPVLRGEPGYGTHLDRDEDGIGCE